MSLNSDRGMAALGESFGLVERLRREGENAMRKHLSMGMWRLCQEAADEIEVLRSKLYGEPNE